MNLIESIAQRVRECSTVKELKGIASDIGVTFKGQKYDDFKSEILEAVYSDCFFNRFKREDGYYFLPVKIARVFITESDLVIISENCYQYYGQSGNNHIFRKKV